MQSLYAKYVKERANKECLETEQGFAIYVVWEDGVYIEDIYVLPEFRKSGVASALADEIVLKAKELKKKRIYGSVCPQANGATDSLKILLAYGFKLLSSSPDLIMFIKEI